MSYIKVDGKNIYYELFGEENEKVLFYLHGGPGASCLDFHNQAVKIGNEYKVIASDQYGVLRSDAIPDNEEYGMEKQIELFEKMREQLGVKKWTLLGHSYGGMLACLYANLYPNSVKAVIYECPSFSYLRSLNSLSQYIYDYCVRIGDTKGAQKCLKIRSKSYEENDVTVMDDVLEMLMLANGDLKVRNYLHAITYEEYASSYPTDGVTRDMWSKGNTHFAKLQENKKMVSDFLPLLRENKQPALLITGRYDPACSKDQIEYFMKEAPDPHTREFSNSGHFPRIEEAEEYTKCVCQFMSTYG